MNNQEQQRFKLAFLLPRSPNDRLWEDGILSTLEAFGIAPEIWLYRKSSTEEVHALANEIAASKLDLVIYPHFDSGVFVWERAAKDWFFGWRNGEPILTSPNEDDTVGITELLHQLDQQGIKTLPLSMDYDGPFEDEITLLRSITLGQQLEKLKELNPDDSIYGVLHAWCTQEHDPHKPPGKGVFIFKT